MEFITLFGTPKKKEPTVFEKIKDAVAQTKENFTERIQDLVQGKKEIDADMLDELEAIMIGADIGVTTTTEISIQFANRSPAKRFRIRPNCEERSRKSFARSSRSITSRRQKSQKAIPSSFLWSVSTASAKRRRSANWPTGSKRTARTVMLCAADTFRAAATEQLEIWASRSDVPIVKQKQGADPSAVLFDALQSAKARKIDYVIVDTAGRLHTKHNLMAELEKMTRIAKREIAGAPHEVLLVMDATTGQNGLTQAREFTKSAGVTGLVLTKLDGTAKGGVVTAIAKDLKIPIRFVGVGEKMDDLIEFSAEDFVESLFAA